jgi:hypothetical protein
VATPALGRGTALLARLGVGAKLMLLVLLCAARVMQAQKTNPNPSPFYIHGVLPWHTSLVV